jgi:hypothetical protein
MKRSATRAGLVALLTGVASALGTPACGNTASNPDPKPKADTNHGGGGLAGSTGQPQASGTGGRASAGTGQTASAGSESLVGGGGGVPT